MQLCWNTLEDCLKNLSEDAVVWTTRDNKIVCWAENNLWHIDSEDQLVWEILESMNLAKAVFKSRRQIQEVVGSILQIDWRWNKGWGHQYALDQTGDLFLLGWSGNWVIRAQSTYWIKMLCNEVLETDEAESYFDTPCFSTKQKALKWVYEKIV